jgi:membrane associated rhomboid family serine protease/Zn-finger nucleic acid-binding protein
MLPSCSLDNRFLTISKELSYCDACQGHFHEKSQIAEHFLAHIKDLYVDTGYDATRVCPCCSGQRLRLLEHSRYKSSIEQCRQCQGVWFSQDGFHEFLKHAHRRLRKGQGIEHSMVVDPAMQKRYERQKYANLGSDKLDTFPLEFRASSPSTWDLLNLSSRPLTLLFTMLMSIPLLHSLSGSQMAFASEHAWNLDRNSWFPEFFTSMLLHASYLHFDFSLLLLWIAGSRLEDFLGPWRFTLLFLGGYGLSFMGILPFLEGSTPLIAAGAPVGVLAGASIVLFEKLRIDYPSIEMVLSAKTWVGMLLSAQTLVLLFSDAPWNAWIIGILGFCIGIGMAYFIKHVYKLRDCSLMQGRKVF